MNERIKELMEQAGLYDFVIESMGINEEIEKFAELIVRECIQAVKNVGGYNEDYHMNAIKKYFGVKE
jgi:hypothetical protein